MLGKSLSPLLGAAVGWTRVEDAELAVAMDPVPVVVETGTMTTVPSPVVLNVVNKIEVYTEPAGSPEPTGTVPITVERGNVIVAVLAEVIVVN